MRRVRGAKLIGAVVLSVVALGTGIAFGAQIEATVSSDESGQRVELPAERTAYSDTYRLPSGMFQTAISEAPINYKAPNGEWKPIEEGLAEQADGSGFTNGANSFDLELPERLGEGPVRLSQGGQWVSSQLLGAHTTAGEVEGDTATYELAQSGSDIDLRSMPTGVKEGIELPSPSSPRSYSFELDASADLTPELNQDGSVSLREKSGKTFAVIPAPIMYDSTPGQPKMSNAARYSLEPASDGGWKLTIDAESDWLARDDLTWPVAIDPSVVIPSPSLDCMIRAIPGEKGPTGLCGIAGTQQLQTAFWPTINKKARALLRFDLSSVPAKASISAAKLSLRAPQAAINLPGIELHRVTTLWDPSLNWKEAIKGFNWFHSGGDFDAANSGTILTSERGSQAGWWNFEGPSTTALVQRWFAEGSSANLGAIVKLTNDSSCIGEECSSERYVAFSSSAATLAENRPKLEVTYYPPAPSNSKIVLPSEGTVSANRLRMKSKWTEPGVQGITFQYKTKTSIAGFKDIPLNLVHDANDEEVKWPFAVSGYENDPLYFEAGRLNSELTEKGGEVEIRAIYTGPKGIEGYSEATKAKIDPDKGGPKDATAQIGPGSVDLLTGNFTMSRTDVAIPTATGSALEFTRTHSSRVPGVAEDKTVLGRGWTPSAPVEAAGGAEWRSVREVIASAEEKEEGLGDYAILTDLEGYEYAFEKAGESYVTPPEMSGWVLSHSGATFSLGDPGGNTTVFESSGGGAEYLPVSISQTGGPENKTRLIYQIIEGNRRLSMIVAPPAPGWSCSSESEATTYVGCKALTFQYKPASSWGAPASYKDRLASITYYGQSGKWTTGSWEVAKYEYDSAGRLTAEWDPRISPTLKELYSYVGSGSETPKGGQLKTITPPGQEPWTFEYSALPGEAPNVGRLSSVKRTSLLESPSVAQTTIAYGVPLGGSGAPYAMGGADVAKWGQQDLPTDATAIFPPDQIPGSPPSSYSRASVYYMDAEGMQVNMATPSGAGTEAPSITTTETDEFGNVVRELTAQNRLRALAAGSESEEIARSHELETKREFSADGTQLSQEWGPMHEVRLTSGTTTQAQLHTTIQYEDAKEGWNGTGVNPHLPTRVTTGAKIPKEGVDADQRVTETKYDWSLRKPTETIVDPSGLNLHTRTAYNSLGQVTERSLPAKSTGGDAHTTKYIYYATGGESEEGGCNLSGGYTGLLCQVMPASQPGTAGQPELLVTKYLVYNYLGQPTEVSESPGGGASNVRKTVKTYDTAGRQLTSKQEGGGVAVPKQETVYSKTQGLPITQRFVCEAECGSVGYSYSSSFGSSGKENGQFAHPAGIAIDAKGNLWVADMNNRRVEKFNEAGEYQSSFGSSGGGNGQLNNPSDVAIAANGNLWVADTGNCRLQEFNEKGEFIAKVGTCGSGNLQFNGPEALAIDPKGNIWVCDTYNHRVQELNEKGEFIRSIGTYANGEGQFVEPTGVAIGTGGRIWIADWGSQMIVELSEAGAFIRQFGGEGTSPGRFKRPDVIEVDGKGTVLVGDQNNERVQAFSQSGEYLTQFGTAGSGEGQFNFGWPMGIAANGKGEVWISDTGNNRVQKWTPTASSDSQAIQTSYDALGRPTEYEDADNNVSSVTYDLLGRAISTYDGKGTQMMTYDPTSGLLVSLADSAAGTFTASYDADGNLIQEGLPNGLVATTTYNEAGEPTWRAYDKKTSCSSECRWLEFGAERSIYGQVLAQSSTLSKEQYSYDKVGRLTLAKETPAGGGCTTRVYGFEEEAGKDSNRTSLVTRPPGVGGACAETGGTKQTYTYDAADRLLGEGIEYDNFGRITSLPGKYAGGETLKTSFYVNNLTASQTQSGITNSYNLDGAMRPRELKVSGAKEFTEVFHYSGGGDSPSWTAKGTAWTRNIPGISGLAAIQDSVKGTSLQLTDLHGDVVATASPSESATKPTATLQFDEFGNPAQKETPRFGWLGGKQRRTELPSGVIQMGVRSYVPAMGRFISVDPVQGGSANAYDYANADPVNGLDLSGEVSGCGLKMKVISRHHRLYSTATYKCPKSAWPFPVSRQKTTIKFERHSKGAIDEFIYGTFETKASWQWTPRNPSDPKWRNWQEKENFRCGDLGREYRITYEVVVQYQSPSGWFTASTENVKASDTAICRR